MKRDLDKALKLAKRHPFKTIHASQKAQALTVKIESILDAGNKETKLLPEIASARLTL